MIRTAIMAAIGAALLSGGAAYLFGDDALRVSRVIDGDTFATTRGERVRLWGIDAPERDEAGGTEATDALRAILAEDASPTCETMDTDRYGRSVMRCTVDMRGIETDVACAMVALGHARDWPRYSGGAYARCAP